MTWREGRLIGRAEFESFGGGLRPTPPLQADGMDEPIVRDALSRTADLRKFLGWSILPVADIERRPCQTTVFIGDARYGELGSRRSRLARRAVVPTPGPGC
jgi:inner membrane protein